MKRFIPAVVLGTMILAVCAVGSEHPLRTRARINRETQLKEAREQYLLAQRRAEYQYIQAMKRLLPVVTRTGDLEQAAVKQAIEEAEKRLAALQSKAEAGDETSGRLRVVRASCGGDSSWDDHTERIRAKMDESGALVLRGLVGDGDVPLDETKMVVVELEVKEQRLFLELRGDHECRLGPTSVCLPQATANGEGDGTPAPKSLSDQRWVGRSVDEYGEAVAKAGVVETCRGAMEPLVIARSVMHGNTTVTAPIRWENANEFVRVEYFVALYDRESREIIGLAAMDTTARTPTWVLPLDTKTEELRAHVWVTLAVKR